MTLTALAPPIRTVAPFAPFVATVTTDGTSAVVTLRGEADAFTLPVVLDVLTRAISEHEGPVIIDLADTSFIDVGTLRALGRASQSLDHRGRTLTLRAPSRMALRLLGLVGMSHLIERDRIGAAWP